MVGVRFSDYFRLGCFDFEVLVDFLSEDVQYLLEIGVWC